jgi:phospholipid/cholesterol/gamma-HCH transport system permease protein
MNRPTLTSTADNPAQLSASGEWVLSNALLMRDAIDQAPKNIESINAQLIEKLDSTGAMLLARTAMNSGIGIEKISIEERFQRLLTQVHSICVTPEHIRKRDHGFRDMLARLGFAMEDYYREIMALVGFFGLTLSRFAGAVVNPKRIRLTPTIHHMEQVGLDAAPLVMVLSFMIGAVIAFLGATVLRDFGAEIFVVELVGISFLREFAVLLTAILLAGRTASAFTAQIGAMQSGEEIDAIRTLGLDPIELLVMPRVLALVITLPLLTFLAMIAGIAGGMAVGSAELGISPEMFIARLHEMMSERHFWVGISKAPLFAVVIALIGCLEGFQVQGTAESVGERTTSSVVQTISLVIAIDALAALFFLQMDW